MPKSMPKTVPNSNSSMLGCIGKVDSDMSREYLDKSAIYMCVVDITLGVFQLSSGAS